MNKIQSIKKFLSAFGNPTIVYNRDVNKISAMVKVDCNEAINQNNDGKDVYFYINEGGTKEKDITKLRACFVDLDAGRDENGKYFSLEKVRRHKSKMLGKIASFKLPPTYIVETRNGYQLYWLLSQPVCVNKDSLAQWQSIQYGLNSFFKEVGADSITKRVNQLFRVPYLKWQKRWEGKTPFDVKLLQCSSKKVYTIDDLTNVTNSNKFINCISSYLNQAPILNQSSSINLDNIISETVDFLLEVQKTLHYSDRQFMSKSAERIANELASQYCV